MATAKPKAARVGTRADSSAAVDEFMAALEHPHKAGVSALRRVIRGTDPSILEGVKWNAPSFRTTEYFATTHLRTKAGVAVIFHLGAKVRSTPKVSIEDPEGLLQWLAKDRAMVTFTGVDDLLARQTALEGVVRQWITHL